MLRTLLLVYAITNASFNFAQIFGPNNPGTYNTTGGGFNWTGTGAAVFNSDNSYASASGTPPGITRELRSRDFGFNLLSTDIIQGIQVDIEKKANSANNVSLLNGWQDGQLSTITNYPLSAGNNRLMVVFVGMENATTPSVTSVTYGGQTMTQLISLNNTAGFQAQLEVWYLTEVQLAAIGPGTYNVNVNLGAFAQNEYFDIISAATFANVDPISPFLDIQTGTTTGGTPNPWALPNPLTVGIGGVAINGIFSGNNTTPASTNGGTNCWTINSGFIEGTDVYRANTAVAPNSGGCFQSAHKFIAANGSEQPSTTFNGTSNRRVLIALSLRRALVVDNLVRLQKTGVSTGSNYAQTTTYWPLNDTYVSYGGPTDMWGTSWSYTDVNHINFGVTFIAQIYNGIAEVDHVRITIFTQSVLPVELIDFTAKIAGSAVQCDWQTSAEINSEYFEIQNSKNGHDWRVKGIHPAAGNSTQLIDYQFVDESPNFGTNYYRLRQFDTDGNSYFSDIRSVDFTNSNEVVVYPNPVHSIGTIDIPESSVAPLFLDARGIPFTPRNVEWSGSGLHFDMSNQADGLYFISIEKNGEKKLLRFSKSSTSSF